jgi:integrase
VAKNLDKTHGKTQQNRAAGATITDIKGKLVEYAWWQKKEGYKETTIRHRTAVIGRLVKLGANLLDPESVKEVIATTDTWKENTKFQVTATYSNFLEFIGKTWRKPRYTREDQKPFIPLEREVDDLIACSSKPLACALQIAKETGARIGEILKLKWTDIDKERRKININPEKGSNSRILPISSKLINMVEDLPKESEWIFTVHNGSGGHVTQRNASARLCIIKRRAAKKLANPRIARISFHTLRHWKGTTEYHKTKDIIHVKEVLGHKSITNTMIYINLEKAVYNETDSEFVVKVAKNLRNAVMLMQAGFEFHVEMDGVKLFKKRK